VKKRCLNKLDRRKTSRGEYSGHYEKKSIWESRHALQMGGLPPDFTTHRFIAEVLDFAVEIGGLAQKRGHVLAGRLVEMRHQPGCGARIQCIRRLLVFARVPLQRVGCNMTNRTCVQSIECTTADTAHGQSPCKYTGKHNNQLKHTQNI